MGQDLRVAFATSALSGGFSRFLGNIESFEHEKNVAEVDLVIFTGGSDISPVRYQEHPNGATGWNDERDEREFNILRQILKRYPKTHILGVCRGMQLLNVGLGGTLIQDMATVDKSHKGVHKLSYTMDGAFSWLTVVNSLHHQAIRHMGDHLYGFPLAIEPETNIVEMACWNNIVLGVQFHPEMFNSEVGSRFFSVVTDWVKGKVNLMESSDSDDSWDDGEDNEEGDDE